MTENKRFRTGNGIFEEGYPSESIIDNKTGKVYYKGYANYASSKEICDLLNKLVNENEELKKENSLFKEIFNEMLIQTQVEMQSNTTKYGGTFIFTGEQFQLLRELMKED